MKKFGSHYEYEDRTKYIDRICVYENKPVCIFGVAEKDENKVIKYEKRKFLRQDHIEAIRAFYQENTVITLEQYDEYYVVMEQEQLKVFAEKKVTALATLEETVFDKIRKKLSSFFNLNFFNKKKIVPIMEIVYDTNPNRWKDFNKSYSKVEAKNRMKMLLTKEREETRVS